MSTPAEDAAKAELDIAANAVAKSLDADILFFNGLINQNSWLATTKMIRERRHIRTNVLLTLVTPGGDPDAAFKIARCLQLRYDKRVFTFIPGWCKSAGTLVTLASRKIFIGDLGELGPLDIQIAKPDELYEMASGLSVQSAFQTLEQTASKMFINLLLSIRGETGRGITTRTAAELAAGLVAALLEPIYRQIEPVKIGENQRAMSITKGYGMRLAQKSGVLKDRKVMDFLVAAYPDHGFVIDREEAADLFHNVHKPPAEMERLADALGPKGLYPGDPSSSTCGADIRFLSAEVTALKSANKPALNTKEVKNAKSRSPVRPKRAGSQGYLGVAGGRTPKPAGRRAGNGVAPNGKV